MKMPTNYFEMPKEEMMNVDGGIQVYQNLRTSNYKILSDWYLTSTDYQQFGSWSRTYKNYKRNISYTCTADVVETTVNKKIGTSSWKISTTESKRV